MQEAEYTDRATIHSAVSEGRESTLEKALMEAVSNIADILRKIKSNFCLRKAGLCCLDMDSNNRLNKQRQTHLVHSSKLSYIKINLYFHIKKSLIN